MGLIWSMIPEPGQRPGRRIIKKDVTTPLTIEIAVLNGFLEGQDVLAKDQTELIDCTLSERFYMESGVQRMEVTEGRLKGTLFLPEGKIVILSISNQRSTNKRPRGLDALLGHLLVKIILVTY